MSSDQAADALRRKLGAARHQQETHGMPPGKALRLALARTAEARMGLDLVVRGVRQEVLDLDSAVGALGAGMLMALLEGPEGAKGLVAFDMQATAAVIECQTLGRVLPRVAPDRPMTRTDAAILVPLLDGMLTGFADNLAEDDAAWWARGFCYGDMIEDQRTLGLALEAAEFTVFRIDVSFADGARDGQIILGYPERPCPEIGPEPADSGPGPFAAEIGGLPAEMQAVIARLPMALDEAGTLEPGTVLPLPADALMHVELCDPGGTAYARGQLGRVELRRALRVHQVADRRFQSRQPGEAALARILEIGEMGAAESEDGALGTFYTEFSDLGVHDDTTILEPDLAADEAMPEGSDLFPISQDGAG